MADIRFNQVYSPAEATRGSWVPIDTDTLSQTYSVSGRGRYAQLNYIIGSEPGSLSLALSGGTVILPVSTVNITEPVSVINNAGTRLDVTIQDPASTVSLLPGQTEYLSTTIVPLAVSAYTFTQEVRLVEIFNNDSAINAYVGFNNVSLATLSAQALPLQPGSFYSVERETTTVYVGNADASSSIDVRVIGHYGI